MINKIKNIVATVERYLNEKDWTISRFNVLDKVKGVGIEDEYREIKVHGETRIDNGIYKFGLRDSPHFSKEYYRNDVGKLILAKDRKTPEQIAEFHTAHEMIWVIAVPNFNFILWHWGCTDDNTEGCYCVGSYQGTLGEQKAVLDSRKKYVEMYPVLWNEIKKGDCYVEYKVV